MRNRTGAIAVASLALLVGLWLRGEPEPLDPVPEAAPTAPEPARPTVRHSAALTHEAASATPEAPSFVELQCELSTTFDGRDCSSIVIPELDNPNLSSVYPATQDGTMLAFSAPSWSKSGFIACDDAHDLFPVKWSAHGGRVTCEVDAPASPKDAPLFGRVAGAEDLPDESISLEGCGATSSIPVDAGGAFFLQAEPGRCSMRAWRQAGALRFPGPWVEVEAISGRDVEVALSVPTWEPAGVGFSFQLIDAGIEVLAVRSGTPAAHAGLTSGDVITTIDGVPTAGMSIDDYLQYGIGPEGTRVSLVGTSVDGRPFEVNLRRSRIEDVP